MAVTRTEADRIARAILYRKTREDIPPMSVCNGLLQLDQKKYLVMSFRPRCNIRIEE